MHNNRGDGVVRGTLRDITGIARWWRKRAELLAFDAQGENRSAHRGSDYDVMIKPGQEGPGCGEVVAIAGHK